MTDWRKLTSSSLRDTKYVWEHVAQRIGRWIQDQKVRGSISNAGYVQKCRANRIPHCLGPPSHNVYLVCRSKVGSIVAGCIGAHLARGKVKSVEHALSWSLGSK